ncbi:4-hydroxy-tetrahydrodipicolinate synthase [Candidatus Margulisiibacteriota bacterium]
MKEAMFGRLMTAMVTPFTQDGKINFEETERLVEFLIKTGSDSILVTGTTGETPTLTHDEEYEMWKTVVKTVNGRVKVMAGTGSNATETSITSTKMAEKVGVDAALIVCPYYNKPPQEGIYAHFKHIAENTSLPIMIYNIPGRTSKNIEPDTIAQMAEIKNIVAVKEASGDLEQMKKIIELTPDDFLLYSGDDNMTLDVLKIGGVGVVSVASHIVGLHLQEMMKQFFDGHIKEAEAINEKLSPLFEHLFITTNPIMVKASLNLMGMPVGPVRLPLVNATPEQIEVIAEDLKTLGIKIYQ